MTKNGVSVILSKIVKSRGTTFSNSDENIYGGQNEELIAIFDVWRKIKNS